MSCKCRKLFKLNVMRKRHTCCIHSGYLDLDHEAKWHAKTSKMINLGSLHLMLILIGNKTSSWKALCLHLTMPYLIHIAEYEC